jgi:hypothetical protein
MFVWMTQPLFCIASRGGQGRRWHGWPAFSGPAPGFSGPAMKLHAFRD